MYICTIWCRHFICLQFSSGQSLSRVRLFVTPWIAARQASLSITNSQSSLRLTSIESVIPSSHLILCWPFFLLLPIPPSIRVFSNESTLCMRWPKYWSFNFSIIPSSFLTRDQTWVPSCCSWEHGVLTTRPPWKSLELSSWHLDLACLFFSLHPKPCLD